MKDLMMWVGKKPYPWPNDFSDEADRDGVSKRVSRKSIPEIVPGETRLVLIHPRAIVKVTVEGMDLYDLAWELVCEHGAAIEYDADQEVDDYITANLITEGQSTSGLTDLLRRAGKAKDLKRLEEKYGIEYHAGVFGYAWLTAVHYVLKAGESEPPSDLENVTGIKAVRMDYSDLVDLMNSTLIQLFSKSKP